MILWHIPPNVIENEMTDDQFDAYFERASERTKREKPGNHGDKGRPRGGGSVPGDDTTQRMVKKINEANERKKKAQVDGD